MFAPDVGPARAGPVAGVAGLRNRQISAHRHHGAVDDLRLGAALRALRLRSNLRQRDLAKLADVSQSLISAIECGRLENCSVATLRRVFAAVGARYDGHVAWRAAAIDRLLDARHAALVEASVQALGRYGWDARVEVTYSIFGERGSIDVLGGRDDKRAIIVEEIKTDLPRLEETVRKLDEKERLTRQRIAEERFGWRPATIGRLLILPDTDRARRQVGANAIVLDAAFPDRGAVVRRWLRAPVGPLSGILFVADSSMSGPNGATVGVQRVRIRGKALGASSGSEDPAR
jgi:transcriptional regulator with XRE-family HTH domain